MKIKNFGIIMSDTSRSRAYIQMLLLNNLIPSDLIILNPQKSKKNQLGKYSEVKKFEGSGFNPSISIFESLDKNSISYNLIDAASINDENVITAIGNLKTKYFIYSGFGGIILKESILNIGKKFIHVHGGFLPLYRGSTCNYYSILKENFIGAASIIMNKEIDKGPILISRKFPVPEDKNILDHYYDPLVRGQVLIETIKLLQNEGILKKSNKESDGDMFYVIHPILKHISILK